MRKYTKTELFTELTNAACSFVTLSTSYLTFDLFKEFSDWENGLEVDDDGSTIKRRGFQNPNPAAAIASLKFGDWWMRENNLTQSDLSESFFA